MKLVLVVYVQGEPPASGSITAASSPVPTPASVPLAAPPSNESSSPSRESGVRVSGSMSGIGTHRPASHVSVGSHVTPAHAAERKIGSRRRCPRTNPVRTRRVTTRADGALSSHTESALTCSSTRASGSPSGGSKPNEKGRVTSGSPATWT